MPFLGTRVVVYDDFDRADLDDGAYIVEGGRLAWEQDLTDGDPFEIVTGTLRAATNAFGVPCVVDVGLADGMTSSIRVGGALGNEQDDNIAFRVADDLRSGYRWAINGRLIFWDVDVYGGNGQGELIDTTVTINDGSRAAARMIGSTITLLQDGAAVYEFEDVRNQTATKHGFFASDGPPGTHWWDDYEFSIDRQPVRQYPRDDGLGHSSATRKFPPVKARRVFGGYN